MTYAEILSTRAARRLAHAATPRCFGCGRTFESYGITKADGFTTTTGQTYCNSDCHSQAEVAQAEQAEFNSLSEEY